MRLRLHRRFLMFLAAFTYARWVDARRCRCHYRFVNVCAVFYPFLLFNCFHLTGSCASGRDLCNGAIGPTSFLPSCLWFATQRGFYCILWRFSIASGNILESKVYNDNEYWFHLFKRRQCIARGWRWRLYSCCIHCDVNSEFSSFTFFAAASFPFFDAVEFDGKAIVGKQRAETTHNRIQFGTIVLNRTIIIIIPNGWQWDIEQKVGNRNYPQNEIDLHAQCIASKYVRLLCRRDAFHSRNARKYECPRTFDDAIIRGFISHNNFAFFICEFSLVHRSV